MNKKNLENPVTNTSANEKLSAVGVVTSEMLFAGKRELVIRHRGEDYILRLTSQGKLILTK